MKRMLYQRSICSMLVLALICFSSGCGSYWYPEREGQVAGTLDSKVVLMDALLCLLFVIPGVVAFYVDIDKGYIYRPSGYSMKNNQKDSLRLAKTAKKIQIQFIDKQGNPVGKAQWLKLDDNGAITNAKALKQIAQKASRAKIYYCGVEVRTTHGSTYSVR